jgi:hypothetical protein
VSANSWARTTLALAAVLAAGGDRNEARHALAAAAVAYEAHVVLAVINQLRAFFRLCSFDLIDKIIHANNEIVKLEDFVFEFSFPVGDQ